MVCFRNNRFYLTLLGAMLIISAVVAKNTAEQLDKKDIKDSIDNISPFIFVLGWAIVAYSIVLPANAKGYLAALELDQNTIQTVVAVVSIVSSVFMMKTLMKNKMQIPMIYPAMFAAGWLLLGYTVGGYLGMTSALLILTSMMGILPWQRENCIVDGPGMPMFTAGWFLLAAANSM